MKTMKFFSLIAWLCAGTQILTAQPAPGTPAKDTPVVLAATNVAAASQQAPLPSTASQAVTVSTNPASAPVASVSVPAGATNTPPPTIVAENTTNGLRLNFRGAPLNLILDYLSDAAGFVINKTTDVKGTVEIWSKEPLTKDETVELLNSVLKKNGYAVSRNGRILTIISMESAKTSPDLEVVTGNDPADVEKSDEVVTQIIPVRYANATQLMANLEVLLPTSATLSVNESANSLIMVATKSDIKRMLKIVTALDTSIASVSSIRVMPLRYADAKDLAALITQLFTPSQSTQTGGGGGGGRGALFNMFGGARGGGGGGGNTAAGGRSSTGTGAAATRVTAVADERSNSLIVSAPADLLGTIAETVDKIDQPVTDVTELKVFTLKNADPTELANQFSQLFPDDTSSSSGNQNQFPFFFRGGFGGQRGGAATTTTGGSDREKKLGRVLAVPDPRTSRLIVTASKTLMPQITEMIEELDSAAGRKEVVGVYDLQNADPQDVQQALSDLFNRSTVRMNSSSSRSLLGQNNPLTQRATQTQPSTISTTTLGSTGSRSATGN